MTEISQARLDYYMDLYEQMKQKVGDTAAMPIIREAAEDTRMGLMQVKPESKQNELATQNQINYLKKLNVSIPMQLTKVQASRMIDEAVIRLPRRIP